MKRRWIEYTDKRKQGPMTFWVHVPCGADPTDVNPPYPVAIPEVKAALALLKVTGTVAAAQQALAAAQEIKALV